MLIVKKLDPRDPYEYERVRDGIMMLSDLSKEDAERFKADYINHVYYVTHPNNRVVAVLIASRLVDDDFMSDHGDIDKESFDDIKLNSVRIEHFYFDHEAVDSLDCVIAVMSEMIREACAQLTNVTIVANLTNLLKHNIFGGERSRELYKAAFENNTFVESGYGRFMIRLRSSALAYPDSH